MQSEPLTPQTGAVGLRRGPDTVMRLARMGAAHPTRLSFMRTLLRRLAAGGWAVERRLWEIDARGMGRAVYTLQGPERAYSLVAFAHDLPPDLRSDRVIATAWDATFALFDGVPRAADLDRLAANVPLQEAGRITARELSLSRANRSVRLFDHVVGRLAAGAQPDPDALAACGYLMRTTAVYGSGKFGAADRSAIADRPEMAGAFQAEMMAVWLIRSFTFDLVEHLARAAGGARAATLDPALRRRLGVGNSTGLGMAPFLINHPVLLDSWMTAREEALARVRALPGAAPAAPGAFRAALAEAQRNAGLWRSEHPLQVARLAELRADLDRIAARTREDAAFAGPAPWDRLWRWGETALGIEGQEALLALLLEPHGAVVDDLAATMQVDEDSAFRIDGAMPTGDLRAILDARYAWALAIDHDRPENRARVWYVSEEKLEPRLGERAQEPLEAYEQPLATARDAARLAAALDAWDGPPTTAAFLMAHPEHRHSARRAQIAARHPCAEIRDNLIGADLMPIDLLRCKLAFFGATRFDPRSDRWVRIAMYQDAPEPRDLLGRP